MLRHAVCLHLFHRLKRLAFLKLFGNAHRLASFDLTSFTPRRPSEGQGGRGEGQSPPKKRQPGTSPKPPRSFLGPAYPRDISKSWLRVWEPSAAASNIFPLLF
eukprot:GHVT01078030.1.p1 GENE.GHVT01078030.1~~GHVT01078030.1.p1  ORF type:complete len:103 (-),score=11.71 GHVT01078030.1:83-391(-)